MELSIIILTSVATSLLTILIVWSLNKLVKHIKRYKYMPKLHNKRVSKKELETWTPEKFLEEYFALDWRYTRSAKKLVLKTIQFKYGGVKELETQVYNKKAEQMKMKAYPYHSHLLKPNIVINTSSLKYDTARTKDSL